MNIVVYAIGGNALSPPQSDGNVSSSHQHILSNAIEDILWLRKEGYNVVVTHGNGPQVGSLMMEASESEQKPLHEWVAVTQDMIGHEIAQPLKAEFMSRSQESSNIEVLVLKTHVLVDQNDPSFQYPTKPIGPVLSAADVESFDWDVANTIHGPRRVVASPPPLQIIEMDRIRKIVDEDGSNKIVICCGGGGIPVIETEQGLEGMTGVIDKDLVSSLLAIELGAHALVIATGVDGVYNDFGQPSAERVREMNANKALEGVIDKTYPPGSMGPKVKACVNAARGGLLAFICQSGQMEEVFQMRSGTLITA